MYFDEEGPVEFFTSGSTLLDCSIGGGWALSRLANIVGDSGTGKSLLCMEAVATHLRAFPDSVIRYNDCEDAYDPHYMRILGIDPKRVEREKIYTVEDCHDQLLAFIEKSSKETRSLFIVDSLDALSSKAELERGIDEGSFGGEKPKKMSEMFRRLHQKIKPSNVTAFIVSQTRDKINSMFPMKTRAGGNALEFYCSQIVWLAEFKKEGKIEKTVQGIKRPIGLNILAKCTKNRVGLPFRTADLRIIFEMGMDDIVANLEWLIEVKGLDKLPTIGGLTPGEGNLNHIIKKLDDMPKEELHSVAQAVAEITKIKWAEIEEGFKPKRAAKY